MASHGDINHLGFWWLLSQVCLQSCCQLRRFLLFMSHAAMCQLWLCNTDIHYVKSILLFDLAWLYSGICFSVGACPSCIWSNFSTLSMYIWLRCFEFIHFNIFLLFYHQLLCKQTQTILMFCVLSVHSVLFFQWCLSVHLRNFDLTMNGFVQIALLTNSFS